jgi:hypothetical protein
MLITVQLCENEGTWVIKYTASVKFSIRNKLFFLPLSVATASLPNLFFAGECYAVWTAAWGRNKSELEICSVAELFISAFIHIIFKESEWYILPPPTDRLHRKHHFHQLLLRGYLLLRKHVYWAIAKQWMSQRHCSWLRYLAVRCHVAVVCAKNQNAVLQLPSLWMRRT